MRNERATGWRTLILCLGLALATAAIYWQVHHFGFTNYDDEHYITRNPLVLQGVTAQSVWRALTTGYFSYWHPLTWISHMLDVQFFGLDPGAHHFASLALHILSGVLLFLVLQRLTGAWAASAFVAAVFALHPTHVESVAWIAERKDVLSGLFWILTIAAYGWYAQRPHRIAYLSTLFLCGCGLMSKPMVVTLPCVLLLLDYWPLARILRFNPASASLGEPSDRPLFPPVSLRRALLEKIPFLGLSLASCAVTIYGVWHAGSVIPDEQFPLSLRLANIPIAYVRYLGKTLWPENLAVIYPMPAHWPLWQVLGASVLLVLITVPVFLVVRRRPYLVVGWLWYLGTLVPTIGLLPVGLQSMADRYTYLPAIGVYLMVAWGLRDLSAHWPQRRALLGTGAAVVLAGCSWVTWRQARVWTNNETLFAHAAAVTAGNATAHYNLGLSLCLRGDLRGSVGHFAEAIRIEPNHLKALNNLGVVLTKLGDPAGATNHLARLAACKPSDALAQLNWGKALMALDDVEGAVGHFAEALRLNPNLGEACFCLGKAWMRQGKVGPAIDNLTDAVRLEPRTAEIHLELARALQAQNQFARAEMSAQQALELARGQREDSLAAACQQVLQQCRARQPAPVAEPEHRKKPAAPAGS